MHRTLLGTFTEREREMAPGEKQPLKAKRWAGKRPRSAFQFSLISALLGNEMLAELEKGSLLASQLHALLRPVIAEEIERGFAGVFGEKGGPLKQITESSARKFHLQFKTNPAPECFTKRNLEDEQHNTIGVMLIDTATGQLVTTGPESVAKLEVVPLMGNFDTPEGQEWSAEEFEGHVEKERKNRGPLLTGDLNVRLNDGEGTLGQMSFTDNSSFTRSKKFRLGVRVAPDNEHGLLSIREGKSQAFRVKDSRGKEYMKHDTPSPTDNVWRLRNIRKDGSYHTKLEQNGITTVEHFLSCLEKDPELLKDVLGKMSEGVYQDTINHAKECIISDDHAEECIVEDKLFIYQVKQPPYESLIFNPNCQVMGAVADGRYVGLEMVADTERVCFDGLVKSTYDHWFTDVECVAEPSMIGTVDGSPENDIIDAAATPHEAIDGSTVAKRVPALQSICIAEPDDVDGDVMAERTSQGQSSGFDMALLSDDLRTQLEGLSSSIADGEVTSEVRHVMRQEYGEPFEYLSLQEPNPAASKYWLRIRSAIRWALFVRRAGLNQTL